MIKLDLAHKNFITSLKNEGKSDSTLVAYSKDIQQLSEHLEKKGVNLVNEITLEHLEGFMKGLSDLNYTLKSISRKTNATRTFIKFLQVQGHIKENIGDMLKHPKLESKAPRILSKLEYRALRDAAREDERSYAMIEVLLQTGVTISELVGIKLEDLDLKTDKGSLTVPKKNAKETRLIPLNHAVVEAIGKYVKSDRQKSPESAHLFVTKTGKALLVRNVRSTINRYFKLAGVEKAKVNDLRHTFVAHHLMAGVSILHLSKIVGHKRISTTERYLQYIEKIDTVEKTELVVL